MAASAWPLSPLPRLLSALVFYKARDGYTRQCPQRTLKMEKHLCKYKEAGVTFCKRMISLQERCVCGGGSTQIKEIPGPLHQPRGDPSPMEGRASVLEGSRAEKPQPGRVGDLPKVTGRQKRTQVHIPRAPPTTPKASPAGQCGLQRPVPSAPKLHGLWNRAAGLPALGKLPTKVLTAATLG